MDRRCAHCLILPKLPGPGSVCGACWLTATNRYNDEPHITACSCWLSHYSPTERQKWREVMTRAPR